MKNKLTSILLILLLCVAGGCRPAVRQYQMQFPILFDTVGGVTVYTDSESEAQECKSILQQELTRLNHLFDIYHDVDGINNLKTVNDQAGKQAVKVDSEILDLITFSKEIYTLTSGRVNVASGAVLRVWSEARDKGVLPEEAALQQAAQHTDIEKVIVDKEAGTVYLADEEMSLDVGAVAKGYAVQLAAEAAVEAGYNHFLINQGGNVLAIGGRENDEPWRVGIKDPLQTEELMETVSVENRAVVSSGVYERYYEVAGEKYHHIIDPDTLQPSRGCISATVITPNSAYADALSTALLLLPPEEGMKLIESRADTYAVVVKADGTKVYSEGFHKVQ